MTFQKDFQVKPSFEQELRETSLGSGIFLPASNTIANPRLKGCGKLHFTSDLSALYVTLEITGNLTGDREVTLAHLHLDQSDKTGPLTVELYPSQYAETKVSDRRFSLQFKVTNDRIIPRDNGEVSTNTVASLYNAIKEGSLYLDCHGKGDYLLGMLRGQIF